MTLTIPRSVSRAFRAMSRKCVTGRPRGPSPPVLLIPEAGHMTLAMKFEEVILTYRLSGEFSASLPFVIPFSVLEALDGPGDEDITIQIANKSQLEIRWSDRGSPRQQSVPLTRPSMDDCLKEVPATFVPVDSEFLSSLHEAGRTTSREPGRFALHRIQLKGATGDIIATDGYSVYWRHGISFPFTTDLLIPAVPVFGSSEFAKHTVMLGHIEKRLVITAGPWTVFLAIDSQGRFPDMESIRPKTPTPTTLQLDEADVASRVESLATLPGHQDDQQPITLDLAPEKPPAIRGRDEQSSMTAEIVLSRSYVENGPSIVALDRRFLKRAIQLGCCTIRVVGSNKPIVALGDRLTMIAASLDPTYIVEPSTSAALTIPTTINPDRRQTMKPHERNGHAPDASDTSELGDPLVEAERLRTSLFEATQAASRLVTILKSKKKEQKALATVFSSLKSLNLGG
jgi:hypothetical protein